MEEKNETTDGLTYEQLEQIALQLHNKVIQTEARLNSINLAAMRLDYLFKILDKSPFFPKKFVDECVAEIIDRLEVKKDSKAIEE